MTEDFIEVQLAKALLQIAVLAMPDSYFATDSRCELARRVLTERGIVDFDPMDKPE